MKHITFKNKLGYFLGDFANTITFAMSSSFLLAFYTDVVGISAAAAGVLFLVSRLWDAFIDPLMGVLVDKVFARRMLKNKGKDVDKFKPFLLMGSWIVIITAILMFWSPSDFTFQQKAMWAYVTYIIWGMCYSFINIPYGSLASVMTQDPGERASLSVARGLGSTVGNVLVRIVVPFFLSLYTRDLGKAYLLSMIALGILGQISYLITYKTVDENIKAPVVEKSSKEKINILQYLKLLIKNRPFISACLGSITMLFGLMTNQAMVLYYFRENLNAISLMGISMIISMAPSVLIAPFVSKLVSKFSVKNVASISSLIAAVLYALIFLLPDNIIIYIAGTLLAGIAQSLPLTVIWGMVSDCIDYNEYLSGHRQEGVIYGSYSFMRKLGQALAGLFAGAGLTMVGYDAKLATQTSSTLVGIKFLTVGLSAIGMFLTFLAFHFIWNLTEEKQKEVIASISKK